LINKLFVYLIPLNLLLLLVHFNPIKTEIRNKKKTKKIFNWKRKIFH